MRNNVIDAMKGIGILLVVIAHALTTKTFIWNCIQQFHMPLFFLVSGYLFKEVSIQGHLKFFLKKFKALYIPWLVVNCGYYIFSFFVGNTIDNILKGIIKVIFLVSPSGIFGATWFLKVLFVTTIIFMFLETYSRKFFLHNSSKIICFFAITMSIFGACTHIRHNVSATFTALFFFSIGFEIKKNLDVLTIINKNKILNVIICIICVLILFYSGEKNNVSFSKNEYDSYILFILAAFSGIYLTYVLGNLVKNLKVVTILGSKTMPILVWQFVAFKFVTLIQYYLFDLDKSSLNAFPFYDNSGIWFVILVISGVVLPILSSEIMRKTKVKGYVNFIGL